MTGDRSTKNRKPPPKQEDTEDVVEFREAGLTTSFLKLVSDRQTLSLRKREVEEQLKELNDQIMSAVATTGHKSVLTPDWRVTFYESHGPSSIKKEKLLEKNVSVEIIKYATVEGKSYNAIQITPAVAVANNTTSNT